MITNSNKYNVKAKKGIKSLSLNTTLEGFKKQKFNQFDPNTSKDSFHDNNKFLVGS